MRNQLSLSLSILLLLGSSLPLASLASDTGVSKSAVIGYKPSKIDLVGGNNSRFLKGRWRRTSSPRWWQLGAKRGNCSAFTGNIIPLLPHLANEEGVLVSDRGIWDTAAASPEIYIYLPLDDAAKIAEDQEFSYQAQFFLTVYDHTVDANVNSDGYETIYETTVELPKQAGIASLNFAEDPQFPVLETGKTYQWDLEILCSSNNDHSINPVVSGWMQKLDDTNLANQIKQASPQSIPSIYENANVWYETVSSLAGLIQKYPQDQKLQQQWQELLQDVGYVDTLVNVPFVGEAKILGDE